MTSLPPINVALVEDDPQTRSILTGWFDSDAAFKLAGHWRDAEAALQELPRVCPDVVLMDLRLPGISGVEAVRRLKPLLPRTQFLVLTVYRDDESLFDALRAGASGFLLKQTPQQELFEAIREVYCGGSPMSSIIARKVVQCFHGNPGPQQATEKLSPREQQILDLLAKGYFLKEAGESLQISLSTVKTHVRRIYEKLHVRSRSEAVAKSVGLRSSQPSP